MSHSNAAKSDTVRQHRRKRADGGALNTDSVKLQSKGGSLLACVTSYGRDTLDLEKGQTVEVETYEDAIVIKPPEGDE